MYLSSVINSTLESKKHKLIGRISYYHLVDILNRAFRKNEAFKFRFERYPDIFVNEYSVSGLYDMETDIKHIIINVSQECADIEIFSEGWDEFKFSISQVCQHEAIHQCQWMNRIDDIDEMEPLDFRYSTDSIEETREYLSDPGEIDAYAHDIAMEIKHYYPNKNPYIILRSLRIRSKVPSYNYYKHTFKNTDWTKVRKHLLKKAYRWLQYSNL